MTWGDVKKYATIQELSLNSAVEHLLTIALDRLGNTLLEIKEGNNS